MQNIYYDQYYNESAVYDYVVSFYTGYQMEDYAFANEWWSVPAYFVK